MKIKEGGKDKKRGRERERERDREKERENGRRHSIDDSSHGSASDSDTLPGTVYAMFNSNYFFIKSKDHRIKFIALHKLWSCALFSSDAVTYQFHEGPF